MTIKSGIHLGIIRNWIKWNARNGEKVIWGSTEVLEMKQLTVRDMEFLAQQISNGIFKELRERTLTCSKFEPDFKQEKFTICANCGNHNALHNHD